MSDDPVTIAAIERLEEHRQRLIAEKVARNEAVVLPDPMPAIAGSPCKKKLGQLRARQRRDGQGREVYYTGTEPRVIVTGVPRPSRDADTFPCPDCDGSCVVEAEPQYLAGAQYQRERERIKHEADPPKKSQISARPALPAIPEPPREWWPFRVQIRAGNGGDDPGAIIEGRYGVADDFIFVEDDQGKPVDMRPLRGENAPAVAQRILREKWRGKSSVSGFYDGPINRPTTTFH